jgi:hypothetical protein
MKQLSPDLRNQIIEAMGKVTHEGIAGYAIRRFAGLADVSTDAEVIQAAENIKSQIHDNAIVMMRVLGDQFKFFNRLRLQARRRKMVDRRALINPVWSTSKQSLLQRPVSTGGF